MEEQNKREKQFIRASKHDHNNAKSQKKAANFSSQNYNESSLASGLITLREAAKIMGCTPQYLNTLSRSGDLVSKKLGRNWYTTEDWLNDFIQKKAAKKEGRNSLIKFSEINVRNDARVFSEAGKIFSAVVSFLLLVAFSGGIYFGVMNLDIPEPDFDFAKNSTSKVLGAETVRNNPAVFENENIFFESLDFTEVSKGYFRSGVDTITNYIIFFVSNLREFAEALIDLIFALTSFFWLKYFFQNIPSILIMTIRHFKFLSDKKRAERKIREKKNKEKIGP